MVNNMKKMIIISLVVVGIIITNLLEMKYNQLPEVILNDNLTVYTFDDVTSLSFISKINNGTIISREEKIDTSTAGKKEVVITIKNKYGKKRDYKYFVIVVSKN